jgi:hypothetical protein
VEPGPDLPRGGGRGHVGDSAPAATSADPPTG